jgi:hypothetical protein
MLPSERKEDAWEQFVFPYFVYSKNEQIEVVDGWPRREKRCSLLTVV